MTLAPLWNFNAQELQLKIISRKKVFLIKYAYFKYKFARRNCTRKTQILTHRLTKFQIPVLPRNYPESNVLKKKNWCMQIGARLKNKNSSIVTYQEFQLLNSPNNLLLARSSGTRDIALAIYSAEKWIAFITRRRCIKISTIIPLVIEPK